MTYIKTRLLGNAQLTIDKIKNQIAPHQFKPRCWAKLNFHFDSTPIKIALPTETQTKYSFSSFLYFIKYSSFRRDWGKGKDTTTLHGLGITQLFCLHHTMLLPSAVTCIPVFDSHVSGKIFLCFTTHNKINW